MSEPERRAYLEFGLSLIAESRRIIAERQATGINVSVKADGSLVTDVDQEVEQALRARIARHYPGHGIIGEEFANTNPDADFQWILDPIDGTDNFAHGIPTFGTIIALHNQGRPLIGITDHPHLGLCYSAAVGLGAFCNGRQLQIAGRDQRVALEREIVITTAPESFLRSGDFALFAAIQHAFPNTRIYRDCFGHTRAIEGAAGAMFDFNVRLWDIAAAQVLVEEAGGKYVRLPPGEGGYERVIFGKPPVVDALLSLLAA